MKLNGLSDKNFSRIREIFEGNEFDVTVVILEMFLYYCILLLYNLLYQKFMIFRTERSKNMKFLYSSFTLENT